MTNQQTLLYALLAGIFSVSTQLPPYPLSYLVKILPVILLLTIVLKHRKNSLNKRSLTLFSIALLWSATGDILLDLNREAFFVFGLGSFLIGHLFFIASFSPLTFKKSPLLVIYPVTGLGLFALFIPALGQLLIPVFIYMLVLLAMACSTILSRFSNWQLVTGGASFLISDSLIGFDKFYIEIPHQHLFVMLTYYLAQYFLVCGLLKGSKQS